MLSYRATLDIPDHRRPGLPLATKPTAAESMPGHGNEPRPAGPRPSWSYCRWLKDGTDIDLLARDAKVSQANRVPLPP